MQSPGYTTLLLALEGEHLFSQVLLFLISMISGVDGSGLSLLLCKGS